MQRKGNGSRCFALTLLFVLLFAFTAVSAFAENPFKTILENTGSALSSLDQYKNKLKIGRLELHPFYHTGIAVDSNINLAPRSKPDNPGQLTAENQPYQKGDFYWTQTPGITMAYPVNEKITLTAGYANQAELMAINHAENRWNSYSFQAVDADFEKWYVNGRNDLNYTSTRNGTTFTERIPRWEESVVARAGARLCKLNPEFEYSLFVTRFPSDQYSGLDFTQSQYVGRLYYELTGKTRVFVDGGVGTYNYLADVDRSAFYFMTDAGIVGDITKRLRANASVGFRRNKYDGLESGEKNFASVITNLNVTYKFFTRTNVDAGYGRSVQQAAFDHFNYYTQDLWYLNLTHPLTRKLDLVSNFNFAIQDYGQIRSTTQSGRAGFSGSRYDQVFTYLLGLNYRLTDVFSLVANYTFARRNSNVPSYESCDFDYIDHGGYFGCNFDF